MFDELRDLYQDTIMRRGRAPTHAGRVEAADGVARGDNPMCGDRVEVTLRRDAQGRVEAVAFEGRGCAISLASADLMCESVRGLDAAGVARLDAGLRRMVSPAGAQAAEAGCGCASLDKLRPLSGVREYPSRVRCATLPWDALHAALQEPARQGGTR